MTGKTRTTGWITPEALWLAGLAVPAAAVGAAALMMQPVPTTLEDFFGPGTQPLGLIDPIESVNRCDSCHGGYDAVHEPLVYAASMMAQASRDPLFRAALTVANQDAAFAGDLCLRCHTPNGWLAGRSTPTDGSLMSGIDLEGLNCNFCHRMVDPVHTPGVDPAVDVQILADLDEVPQWPHSGHFVVDPLDRRRGPFDLGSFNRHEWLESPFHSSSQMCATCHDVSNPVFERQPDGSYMPGTLGARASSDNPYDQFPVERTYSEWLASAFAQGPIDMGGRFGGNLSAVSSCQDCHMPDGSGRGARQGEFRTNLPTHFFHGGSTWVLQAVRNLYPDSDTKLSDQMVADALARTEAFLAAASETTLTQDNTDLVVRVTNYTGHKLPTGYPEGRRMWLHVEFYDDQNNELAEFGAYDESTATLNTADTKVYEAKLGISAALAPIVGKPAGESFHFALNNEWLKDNRIPPMGFENSAFEAVQAAPVGAVYADGQHWDDTRYTIPPGAGRAEVTLYYQSASREYIEFLRDANTTDDAGDVLHTQWIATGMGAPIAMNSASLTLEPVVEPCLADLNGNGVLDPGDFTAWVSAFNAGDPAADQNANGALDPGDFTAWVSNYNAGC